MYTEIEIGGKTRGLCFNRLALEIFSKVTDTENIIGTMSYALFYAGLRGNSFFKREQPDYTFEQACYWHDELKEEDFDKINRAFESATSFRKLLPKVQENEELNLKKKKKAGSNTGRTAKPSH